MECIYIDNAHNKNIPANNINANNKIIKQNLNIIYKNRVNNNEETIYGNNNLTLIENNKFLNDGAIKSSVAVISKVDANYIVTFNVISVNNNYNSSNNYSACEIVNNHINKIDMGPHVLYNTSNNPLLIINNNINILEIPYIFHLYKNNFYYIDPTICPSSPCSSGGGSGGSSGGTSTCTVTTKKCAWSVSGNTDIISSINLNNNPVSFNGGTVKATVHIASFSSSSGSGTAASICGHDFTVSGTGTFTFNINNNYNGNVNTYVSYVSCKKVTTYLHCNPDYAHTDVSISHSSTAGASYHNYLLHDYIGYNGNSVIYLSDISHEPTYDIYKNINITDSTGIYHSDSDTTDGYVANNSAIIGKTAYTEYDGGSHLYISLNMTATGAGKSSYVSATPYRLTTTLQTENAASGVCAHFLTHSEVGYNVSNLNTGNTRAMNDVISLMADAMSLIPVAGYAVTAVQAAGTAYNLIQCIISPGAITNNAIDNKPAEVIYNITGGTYCSGGNLGQNVYSSGIKAHIRIPNNDLNSNFSIKTGYETQYACPHSIINAATTTNIIHAVTSSAICGSVGLSNTSQARHPSLNSSLYIKNVNNDNYYKVPIVNGRYLFFAQPDTEYTMYYLHNGTLQKFDYLNPSGSITQLNNFTTPSAGNSDNIDIF